MYPTLLEFINQNSTGPFRIQLSDGTVLNGRWDKEQVQALMELRRRKQLNELTHFRFVLFKTDQGCSIINTKQIVTIALR